MCVNGIISLDFLGNGSTLEIPCPAPEAFFYGQDGNYSINPPSYTKLDASGNALPDTETAWTMIKDNVTGLIWENKTSDGTIHDGSMAFTWCDTNPETNGGNQGICETGTGSAATDTEAFIKALNDATFGGFSDWRLPTIKELTTIVLWSQEKPSINATWFPNTEWSYYWSSSTLASGNGSAWGMSCSDGSITYDNSKTSAHSVRAVRGGQSRLLGSLVISAPTQADRWNIGEQKTIAWDGAGISGNVKIALSRQGGKTDTFTETIADGIANSGSFNWTVTGPASYNCVLKIEPLNDITKGTTQGLFSIPDTIAPTLTVNPAGGIYVGTQSITLLSVGEAATIYYTLDGSEPTTNSPVYSAAIPFLPQQRSNSSPKMPLGTTVPSIRKPIPFRDSPLPLRT
jgi:hypothetical protein